MVWHVYRKKCPTAALDVMIRSPARRTDPGALPQTALSVVLTVVANVLSGNTFAVQTAVKGPRDASHSTGSEELQALVVLLPK